VRRGQTKRAAITIEEWRVQSRSEKISPWELEFWLLALRLRSLSKLVDKPCMENWGKRFFCRVENLYVVAISNSIEGSKLHMRDLEEKSCLILTNYEQEDLPLLRLSASM